MPNKLSTLTMRWMEEVWNRGREEAIDELLDDKAIIHGLEGVNEPGPAGFKRFYKSFREQFPSVNIDVHDVVSQEDYETSRCTVQATNANGQNVHFDGMTFLRVSQGKIVEAWNNFDFMSMYQQLGFNLVQEEMHA
jgi:predicted SnoaL-like aldol condensation-catalyzing enzyme